MSYLLDTNVISEWVKPRPDPRVIRWLSDVDEERVFLSAASFAEISEGIELLPQGRRRARLSQWLAEELPHRFEGRILAIDRHVAEVWGVIIVHGRKAGIAIGSMDAFFAATAAAYGLTLVTRNTKDFVSAEIPLVDPWGSPTRSN